MVVDDSTEYKSNYEMGTKQPKKYSNEDFERIKVLGKGSYGKVYLVRLKTESSWNKGRLFAMKVLKKEELFKRKQVEHTMAEWRILEGTSNHPFVVGLFCSF